MVQDEQEKWDIVIETPRFVSGWIWRRYGSIGICW